MKQNFKRVAVCLSGGVDSSTTALLLQLQGYDVVGLTAQMTDNSTVCGEQPLKDAAQICEQLGLNHYTIDLRCVFKERIINKFLEIYSKGKTPNPCVFCNKIIKWGELYKHAKEKLNCDYIATGHYVIVEELDGEYKIKRPKDRNKDQTYMLAHLTQEDLAHTIFPLGYYEKDEIKELARKHELITADRKESQDVCFIEETEKIQEFLERHLGQRPGKIVDCSTDEIIGDHTGVYRFTIGQRKGIKVAYPYPLYVVSIDTDNNIIFVGAKEDIKNNNLIADKVNWISGIPEEKIFFALCQIRYNSSAKLARIEIIDDTSVNITFDEPEYAITPGQLAAFYSLDNQYLLGGGWIQ